MARWSRHSCWSPWASRGELLRLLADPEWALDRLIDEVTVKETYFSRNPPEFEQISWRPHLRVWNPACSSGDEGRGTCATLSLRR